MKWFRVIVLAAVCALPLGAAVRLPAILSDRMLLQREKPLCLWGWADPGERVEVFFLLQTRATNAGPDGRWQVTFPKGFSLVGGPFTLTVQGKNRLVLHDILIGDLWLLAGQSNMEHPVRKALHGPSEVSNAWFPRLRVFQVGHLATNAPAQNASGKWVELHHTNLGGVSALGFYFARDLWRRTGMPQGFVEAAWGEAPPEAWMSPLAIRTNQRFDRVFTRTRYYLTNEPNHPDFARQVAELRELQKLWDMQVRAPFAALSNLPAAPAFASIGWDDHAWKTLSAPGLWEDQGVRIDGVLWYRRQVAIPRDWSNRALTLSLGRVSGNDLVFWDGTNIGGLWTDVPTAAASKELRKYRIPAALVRPGMRQLIAVRIYDGAPFARGGFTSSASELALYPEGAEASNGLSLAGAWKTQIEISADPLKYPPRPEVGRPAAICSAAWNGMLAPFSRTSFQGALFWQGENTASRAALYQELFPDLVRDWRASLGDRDLPFFYVQAPALRPRRAQPQESELAELRESQAAALSLKHTGLVAALDLGSASNALVPDKQAVAKRAVLHALAHVWKMKLETSGPVLKSVKFEGPKARVHFDRIGSGLVVKNPPGLSTNALCGFALCGADRKWVWAQAVLRDKDTVECSHPEIAVATAVRYGWADNPAVNLYSREGLPALPFRTDHFPKITQDVE
ncbi:MAG: hypothetical protein J0L75_13550 [Spirochaetes bacterium]|nr:hypothetical protein [Spirochaetota bacterium]